MTYIFWDNLDPPRLLAGTISHGLRLKPMPIMSLWRLQKWLLMLLFQFSAEQKGRVFHTAGVLLEHNDTNHRWLPRQMWLCRTAVWVYKGFNENLAIFQAWINPLRFSAHAHIGQSANVHPVDGVGNGRVKSSYLGNKAKSIWLNSQTWGLGGGTVIWKGSW